MGIQLLESRSNNRQSKDYLLTNLSIRIRDVCLAVLFQISHLAHPCKACTTAETLLICNWEGRSLSKHLLFEFSRGSKAHRHASCRYQNLSATFLSYKLQNSDRPYSAVESAQPGPSFEKLRFRSLSCCQSLTSLNLHTMQCLKTFGGCESLEKLQVCRRRVHAQTPLSQTRCKLCTGEHTQIWRCTKLVRVQISRCWKLLLQCIDVEACQKLDFLVIQGSCEMGLSN